jgi:hypothetical protein
LAAVAAALLLPVGSGTAAGWQHRYKFFLLILLLPLLTEATVTAPWFDDDDLGHWVAEFERLYVLTFRTVALTVDGFATGSPVLGSPRSLPPRSPWHGWRPFPCVGWISSRSFRPSYDHRLGARDRLWEAYTPGRFDQSPPPPVPETPPDRVVRLAEFRQRRRQ